MNQVKASPVSEAKNYPARKPYARPVLRNHGRVHEVTKGVNVNAGTDGGQASV